MNGDSPIADARRRRFQDLVAEVYEPIQRYARRRVDPHAVDDIVSETLMTLWRRLDEVPPEALPWAYGSRSPPRSQSPPGRATPPPSRPTSRERATATVRHRPPARCRTPYRPLTSRRLRSGAPPSVGLGRAGTRRNRRRSRTYRQCRLDPTEPGEKEARPRISKSHERMRHVSGHSHRESTRRKGHD